jgi:acyl carrier protein
MSEGPPPLGELTSDKKVLEVVNKHFSKHRDIITPDTRFKEDLGADSLDNAELVMALEDECDTTFPDAEAQEVQTVGDVMLLVRRLVANETARKETE